MSAEEAARHEKDFQYMKDHLKAVIELGESAISADSCRVIGKAALPNIMQFALDRPKNPHYQEMVFLARQCYELYLTIQNKPERGRIDEHYDWRWKQAVSGNIGWLSWSTSHKVTNKDAYILGVSPVGYFRIMIDLPEGSVKEKTDHLNRELASRKLPPCELSGPIFEHDVTRAKSVIIDPAIQWIIFTTTPVSEIYS